MCLLCVCCLLRFVVSFVLQATTFHSCRHASLPYFYSYGHCVVVCLLSLILNATSLISHRLLDFLHFSPLLILDEADTITFSVAKLVQAALYYRAPLYWMDFGNTQTSGQVVLGTVPKKIKQPKSQQYKTVDTLKVITRYVKYASVEETDSGPSCSLAEALEKQDLYINSTLAQLGCNLLWKMFRNGMLEHHGIYLNLATMKVNPIYV